MFEPLRFLHIADAALDLSPRDLRTLPEPLQLLAEDATLLAFDHLIDAAISHRVDFLLLTGSTFRERDRSLRARLNLISGLHSLKDEGISVFVLPGPDDPESAWRAIPDLPANVTVLSKNDQSESPIAVLREGKVIATIAAKTLSRCNASDDALLSNADPNRSEPFRIGLVGEWPSDRPSNNADEQELSRCLSQLACDYLAVPIGDETAQTFGWRFEPGQTLNTNDGIAHHPDPLQALSSRETGPHGATVIEVDEEGEIRGTFLPLAVVRRLHFEVSVSANASVEDVAEAMISQLESENPAANEQGWFILWTLTGTGENFETFKAHLTQSDLFDLLPGELSGEPNIAFHHQLRFEETTGQTDDVTLNELERLYRQTLDAANDPRLLRELSDRVLLDVDEADTEEWRDVLTPLVRELDFSDVLTRAQALGREWFSDKQGD